jgi:hypothetical protein
VARKSESYEFIGVVHRSTDRAMKISESGEEKEAVWLRISEIEVAPGPRIKGVAWSKITVPEWLAIEKGLV